MKQEKRIASLILALVMICGLMVNASAAEAQEIKAQLSYDITVSFNGEAQTLTDAAGNIVYPISYNGTTYLPVRAVSYVLGIAVDWDGATQTVLLSDGEAAAPKAIPATDVPSGSKDITAQLTPGITVKYNGEVRAMTDAAGNAVYPVSYEGTTYLPVRAVSNMLGVKVDWDGVTQTVLLNTPASSNDTNNYGALGIYTTSADAEVFGENYIGYDWAEIDWSTANDGYVRVKWIQNIVNHAVCTVHWIEDGKLQSMNWRLNLDQCLDKWMTIPLTAGSRDYAVIVEMLYFEDDLNDDMTEEEMDAIWREYLCAQFSADITDPDAWMLMSSVLADYQNSPNASAKALELTENCKTDAEKITTIFNYVAKTLTYDKTLYNSEKARIAAGESLLMVNNERNLNPDAILVSKKGVCEHYATLMAAMLRSIGVPCKLVSGSMIKSDGSTESHAWVAVKPATGTLNKSALAAGMEPDGEWVRLDPTNALKVPKTTSNDSNYRTNYYY